MMKRIAILGSTGSIGVNSLDVISRNPELFEATYLTTYSKADVLIEQVRRFHPKGVVVLDPAAAGIVFDYVGNDTEVLVGEQGLLEVVTRPDVDLVISALVGFAGLKPTMRAIETGKDIALANKETLVVAGEIINGLVAKHRVSLLPIDSEHSAILQCIAGESASDVEKIILTASGGPFRSRTKQDLLGVTVRDALNHPNWKMGNKITIDSATMMNKGLEVIEAHWLFHLPPERIDVLVHPQSIIHSMVQFADGSIKAQLGMPDMRVPIQYALTYPRHLPTAFERIDFGAMTSLTFEQPDRETFRCLGHAYHALRGGGTMPAVLNAANEAAVQAFLDERIGFVDIADMIDAAMQQHSASASASYESIVDADAQARTFVMKRIARTPKHIFIPTN